MFCFSRANHASTNLKTFSSSKLNKFTLFAHSVVGWNLENRYKQGVSIFFRLSWHFKREKSVFWKASFCKTRTDYACIVDKTLRLVRISVLISALNKRVLLFLSWKFFFYKSNGKLFSCVCISWYKHPRGWESLDSNANPPLRLGFAQLSRILPNLLVFVSGYANTENVFYCLNVERLGHARRREQGWGSGESTRLPPMWPRLKSRRRRHM